MASRYDVNALSGLLSAQSATQKPIRASSLREYRNSGAISRSTMNKMGEIQPEMDKFNRNLSSAQSAARDYATAAENWNTEADGVDAGLARYNANPSNTGLLKAMGNYQQRLANKEFAVEQSIRRINGGEELRYTQADIDKGLNAPTSGPETRYTDTPNGRFDPETGAPLYDRTFNVKDPARAKLDLSGDTIKSKSAAVQAAIKHDSKRAASNANQKSPVVESESESKSAAFEDTGNTAISSLAKYRSARG